MDPMSATAQERPSSGNTSEEEIVIENRRMRVKAALEQGNMAQVLQQWGLRADDVIDYVEKQFAQARGNKDEQFLGGVTGDPRVENSPAGKAANVQGALKGIFDFLNEHPPAPNAQISNAEKVMRMLASYVGKLRADTAPYIFKIIRHLQQANVQDPLKDQQIQAALTTLNTLDRDVLVKTIIPSFRDALGLAPDSPQMKEFTATVAPSPVIKEEKEDEKKKKELSEDDKAELQKLFNDLQDKINAQGQDMYNATPGTAEEKQKARNTEVDRLWGLVHTVSQAEGKGVDATKSELLRGVLSRPTPWSEADLDKYINLFTFSATGEHLPDYAAQLDITNADFIPVSAEKILLSLNNLTQGNYTENEYFKIENGHFVLREEVGKGKDIMRTAVADLANKLYAVASANTSVGFREAYSPYYEGNVEKYITSQLQSLTRNKGIQKFFNEHGDQQGYRQFNSFVSELIEQLQNEDRLRTGFHGLVQKFFDNQFQSPDDLKQINTQMPASVIAAIMSGSEPEQALFNLALCEFERYLSYRIVSNGGEIPVDLFTGSPTDRGGRVRQDMETLTALVHNSVHNLANSGTLPPDHQKYFEHIDRNPAAITRALLFAPAFSLAQSQRGEEELLKGHGRADLKHFPNMLAFFSMAKDWHVGTRYQTPWQIPGAEEMKYDQGKLYVGSGWLLPATQAIRIRLDEPEDTLGQQLARRWIPLDLHEAMSPQKVKGAFEELQRKLGDKTSLVGLAFTNDELEQMIGRFFPDTVGEFSTFGFYTKNSWRVDAAKAWYKNKFGSDMGKDANDNPDWETAYQNMRRKGGAGMNWLWDDSRTTDEVKHAFLLAMFGRDYKKRYDANLLSATFDKYQKFVGDQRGAMSNTKIKDIPGLVEKLQHMGRDIGAVGDHHQHEEILDMNLWKFMDEKKMVYKGMNLRNVMERSPYDFLLLVGHLEPELNKLIDTKDKSIGLQGKVTAYDYYFNNGALNLPDVQRRDSDLFIKHLQKRWGADNVEHFKQIALFWHKFYNLPQNIQQSDQGNQFSGDAAQKLFELMSTATESVKMNDREKMVAEDIVYSKLGVSDQTGSNDRNFQEGVKSLLLDQGGLVSYFDGLGEDFANGRDQEFSLGSRGFFYRFAKIWTRDQRMFMTTNEMNQTIFFKDASTKADEDVFVRLWGSVKTFNDAVSGIKNLDSMLMESAISGNFSKFDELMGKIYSLRSDIGAENTQKLNSIIAQLVVRFFQTDYRTRFPLPLSMITGLDLGKGISLANLALGYHAINWNTEDIRQHVLHWVHEGYLAEEGPYSGEAVLKMVGADVKKYAITQAGPSIAAIILIVFLTAAVMKGAEELSIVGVGGGGGGGHH